MEGGLGAVAGSGSNFVQAATKTLSAKADNLRGQIVQIAANVRVLEKEDLIRLFYDIYNGEIINASAVTDDVQSTIVTPK